MNFEAAPKNEEKIEAKPVLEYSGLLGKIPEDEQNELVDKVIEKFLKHKKGAPLEDLLQESAKIEQNFHNENRRYRKSTSKKQPEPEERFKPDELLRLAMHHYMTDQFYEEHRFKPLINDYQVWLDKNDYKNGLVDKEKYQSLVEEAKELIELGEANVKQVMRDNGLLEEAANDELLEEIIADAYTEFSNSFS